VIDTHPDYPNLVIVSPCSGHGFKFVSVIGEIAADLAIYGTTRHDISLFQLARFSDPLYMASIPSTHRALARPGQSTGAGAQRRSHTQGYPTPPAARGQWGFQTDRQRRGAGHSISQAQATEWGYTLPEDIETFW
jgi:hypothetical protein